MNYFSLFSGIGGFELGIEKAHKSIQRGRCETTLSSNDMSMFRGGLERGRRHEQSPICVGFSEIDRYAIQIYKKHFPSHKEYGDVTNIKCSNVPDFELLCGGFPCQSFSIAGKRGGFSDTQGTLFFEIAQATQEKQPRLLLLENVKGLLSHDKGRTFGTILNTLDELGYDLQWQVLNSKDFGVPQNRERVFIIGHLRTTPRPQVFPLLRSDSNTIQGDKKTTKQFADTITAKYGTRNARGTHITTMIPYGTSQDQKLSQNISQSLNAGHFNQPKISENSRIRRLTPTECERLQGFPDGWTSGISDTQRYKCLGNAVTVNVISAIMEKLLDFPRRVC